MRFESKALLFFAVLGIMPTCMPVPSVSQEQGASADRYSQVLERVFGIPPEKLCGEAFAQYQLKLRFQPAFGQESQYHVVVCAGGEVVVSRFLLPSDSRSIWEQVQSVQDERGVDAIVRQISVKKTTFRDLPVRLRNQVLHYPRPTPPDIRPSGRKSFLSATDANVFHYWFLTDGFESHIKLSETRQRTSDVSRWMIGVKKQI